MWVTNLVFICAIIGTYGNIVPEGNFRLEEYEEISAQNNNHITYRLFNPTSNGLISTSENVAVEYDPNLKTAVLIHGERGSSEDSFSREVRQAFRDYEREDWNVFVMDWHYLASGSYSQVVQNVRPAADDLVRFLEQLKIRKSIQNNNDLHLIGFGIGAHLAGNAGSQLRQFAVIARITGLDPVGRNFGSNSQRLSENDAEYVEVIHTDGGVLGNGIGTAIGHVDFFMNGGNNQPGCLSTSCSHNRSWEFFIASLYRAHLLGNRCNTMAQVNLNSCSGPSMFVGLNLLNKVPMLPGVYRANTGRNFPF